MTDSTMSDPSDSDSSVNPLLPPSCEPEPRPLSQPISSTPEPRRPHTTRCPLHRAEHDDEEKCLKRRLRHEEEEVITSVLLNPITISFSDERAKQRQLTSGKSKILPQTFYRTFYETSMTLCSRVSKDTHAKHRERPDLKIEPGNAFQAIGKRSLKDAITKEGIERHLKWNKKRDPSQFISTFNELSHAIRRARFHYDASERIGDRVSIAEISSNGLVAATLSAPWEMVWQIITQLKPVGKHHDQTKSRIDMINVPIWVSADAVPADESSITAQHFEDMEYELWMSITELRTSDFTRGIRGHNANNYIMAKGHTYEWLALHAIPESRILSVMPFDGDNLHHKQGKCIVRSKYSMDDWVFDWKTETWRMDTILYSFSMYQEEHGLASKSKKRRSIDMSKINRIKRKEEQKNAGVGGSDEPRATKLSRRQKPVPRRSVAKPVELIGTCISCSCNCRRRTRREASI